MVKQNKIIVKQNLSSKSNKNEFNQLNIVIGTKNYPIEKTKKREILKGFQRTFQDTLYNLKDAQIHILFFHLLNSIAIPCIVQKSFE